MLAAPHLVLRGGANPRIITAMDPFTLLLTAIMAGLALTGAGVITTLVVLERPCAEPVAALSNGHRPRRRCRS